LQQDGLAGEILAFPLRLPILGLLMLGYMPAVLVEIGFGTNKAEAKYISDPKSQKALAAAVAAKIE